MECVLFKKNSFFHNFFANILKCSECAHVYIQKSKLQPPRTQQSVEIYRPYTLSYKAVRTTVLSATKIRKKIYIIKYSRLFYVLQILFLCGQIEVKHLKPQLQQNIELTLFFFFMPFSFFFPSTLPLSFFSALPPSLHVGLYFSPSCCMCVYACVCVRA